LTKIYGQTLTRNYFNSNGSHIMLSIAYGGDQSKEFEVHRPEVCYGAQGFQVLKSGQDVLTTKFGSIPVKRLLAVQGNRSEPITYWIMVGDEAGVGMKVKLAQIRYGLTGTVPDGMLVRVSSISSDENTAYTAQDDFIREMLAAMSKQDRFRLTGHLES
jgi:EpsI family protein